MSDQGARDYVTARARQLLDQPEPDDSRVWSERGQLRWAVQRLLDLVEEEVDEHEKVERALRDLGGTEEGKKYAESVLADMRERQEADPEE